MRCDPCRKEMSYKMPSQKSMPLTYVFWLLGGWFGLHHLYLGRDSHAFLTGSSFGGFVGIGWLRDSWKIPEYVRDANEDQTYIEELKKTIRLNEKPPMNIFRQCAAVLTGYFWGWLYSIAVPNEILFGSLNLGFLKIYIPVAIALGVHTVGNVGRIKGGFGWPLLGASSYVFLKELDIDGMLHAAIASTILFHSKAAEWRKRPRKKKSASRRAFLLGAATMTYLSLWAAFLYFNVEVVSSTGENIQLRYIIASYLKSQKWEELNLSLEKLLHQSYNWDDDLHYIGTDFDENWEALKVLGLDKSATSKEITSRWRTLLKTWHPDRFKDEDEKKEAHIKYIEYNAAYENLLDSMKTRKR